MDMAELYVVGDCRCRHCGAVIGADVLYCGECVAGLGVHPRGECVEVWTVEEILAREG